MKTISKGGGHIDSGFGNLGHVWAFAVMTEGKSEWIGTRGSCRYGRRSILMKSTPKQLQAITMVMFASALIPGGNCLETLTLIWVAFRDGYLS